MNNKERNWDELFGITGFIIMIGSLILMFIIDNRYAFILLCGTIIGIILMLLGLIIDKLRDFNERDIVEKNKSDMSEWFNSKIKEYGINTEKIIYRGYRHYYWVKDGKLFLFPHEDDFIRWHVCLGRSVDYCEENAKLININIPEIEYFKIEGDISYITNFESSGINVKGAAIGAMVAGDAGMIIGSRPQIKSNVETKDSRYIELKYKSQGELKTIIFDYSALDVFRDIFPEKEYDYANFKSENLEENGNLTNVEIPQSLEERFEKLRDLKNSGLITEEEFSDKKRELLKQL